MPFFLPRSNAPALSARLAYALRVHLTLPPPSLNTFKYFRRTSCRFFFLIFVLGQFMRRGMFQNGGPFPDRRSGFVCPCIVVRKPVLRKTFFAATSCFHFFLRSRHNGPKIAICTHRFICTINAAIFCKHSRCRAAVRTECTGEVTPLPPFFPPRQTPEMIN